MSKGLVVITGASSGFGEATAHSFAKLGYSLALGARRVEKLAEVAKACEQAGSPKAVALPLDVTSKESIDSFAKAAGTPEILINNAGLARGVDAVDKLKDDDIVAMINTNVTGLLRVTRAFLPGMIEAGKGHVINLDSIAGYQVYEGGVVYCMTKHAVRAISEGMRLDVNGKNIRVTDIAPGASDTEFSSVRLGDAEKAKNVYKGYEPLHAQDVADAIVWAATRPPHVVIHEILMTCTAQASVTKFSKKT
jgi:3-hydroxy acid dehydrogenase/malonic semialdehyde reductase